MTAGVNINGRRSWLSGYSMAAIHTIKAPTPGSHPHPAYNNTEPSFFRNSPYTTPDKGFLADNVWASSPDCPACHHPDNFKIVAALQKVLQMYNGYTPVEPFKSAVMETLEIMNDVGCKSCALYALGTYRIMEGLRRAGYEETDLVYKLFAKYTEKSLDPNEFAGPFDDHGQRWINSEDLPRLETDEITRDLIQSQTDIIRKHQLRTLKSMPVSPSKMSEQNDDSNLETINGGYNSGQQAFPFADANPNNVTRMAGGNLVPEVPYRIVNANEVPPNAIPYTPQPRPQIRLSNGKSVNLSTLNSTHRPSSGKDASTSTERKYKKKNRNWVRPNEPLKRKYSKNKRYKSFI